MKVRKWFIFLVMALLMVALLAGCGIGETPAPNGENGEEEEEGEEGDASGSSPLACLVDEINESQKYL